MRLLAAVMFIYDVYVWDAFLYSSQSVSLFIADDAICAACALKRPLNPPVPFLSHQTGEPEQKKGHKPQSVACRPRTAVHPNREASADLSRPDGGLEPPCIFRIGAENEQTSSWCYFSSLRSSSAVDEGRQQKGWSWKMRSHSCLLWNQLQV